MSKKSQTDFFCYNGFLVVEFRLLAIIKIGFENNLFREEFIVMRCYWRLTVHSMIEGWEPHELQPSIFQCDLHASVLPRFAHVRENHKSEPVKHEDNKLSTNCSVTGGSSE